MLNWTRSLPGHFVLLIHLAQCTTPTKDPAGMLAFLNRSRLSLSYALSVPMSISFVQSARASYTGTEAEAVSERTIRRGLMTHSHPTLGAIQKGLNR